jgi:hypothetical protein
MMMIKAMELAKALRVLGVFRNTSECVGSRDGNGDSGSLIVIKFEHDFNCRGK